MSFNEAEFQAVNQEGLEDEPLDGRDAQPVSEGSSDEPQTLKSTDPLRSDEAMAHDQQATDPLAVATESSADLDQTLRENFTDVPAASPDEPEPTQSGE